jgi:NAD(P)-dependent dehydrogenase (short-subunit alcohol dehydrogenase family)
MSIVAVAVLIVSGCAGTMATAPKPFNVVEVGIPDLQKALAEGRLTSRQLVVEYLTRIALYEDQLKAIITVNPKVLQEADALDREYGVMGRAGMGQYDTTKAAVLGLTRALAVEEAKHGIRVNAVCPGGTITPYHIQRAARQGVGEAELRGSRSQDNLLGRWAEPREVAFPTLFLACAESSFVTGATIMVDAGRSIL